MSLSEVGISLAYTLVTYEGVCFCFLETGEFNTIVTMVKYQQHLAHSPTPHIYVWAILKRFCFYF